MSFAPAPVMWRAVAVIAAFVSAGLGGVSATERLVVAGALAASLALVWLTTREALAVAGFGMLNIMLLSVSVWSGAEGATRDLFHLRGQLSEREAHTGAPANQPPVDDDPPEIPQAQTVQSLVRAVEISLTQPNNQAVSRVFLTGGVY